MKICGITNLEDAFAAVDYGADVLGFVFYPQSPRAVTPENARSIIDSLPPFVKTAGVFVDEDPAIIEETARHTGLDLIQFHGSESPEQCLRANKKFLKAFRIKDLADLEPLSLYQGAAAFLLDTYSPDAPGGTGHVFNWEIAIEAKKMGRIVLAGGLNPGNIDRAVKMVQPYGVDVSSGVEGSRKGHKDHEKMRIFIERAKNASVQHPL